MCFFLKTYSSPSYTICSNPSCNKILGIFCPVSETEHVVLSPQFALFLFPFSEDCAFFRRGKESPLLALHVFQCKSWVPFTSGHITIIFVGGEDTRKNRAPGWPSSSVRVLCSTKESGLLSPHCWWAALPRCHSRCWNKQLHLLVLMTAPHTGEE